jgi:hypothetical protein
VIPQPAAAALSVQQFQIRRTKTSELYSQKLNKVIRPVITKSRILKPNQTIRTVDSNNRDDDFCDPNEILAVPFGWMPK